MLYFVKNIQGVLLVRVCCMSHTQVWHTSPFCHFHGKIIVFIFNSHCIFPIKNKSSFSDFFFWDLNIFKTMLSTRIVDWDVTSALVILLGTYACSDGKQCLLQTLGEDLFGGDTWMNHRRGGLQVEGKNEAAGGKANLYLMRSKRICSMHKRWKEWRRKVRERSQQWLESWWLIGCWVTGSPAVYQWPKASGGATGSAKVLMKSEMESFCSPLTFLSVCWFHSALCEQSGSESITEGIVPCAHHRKKQSRDSYVEAGNW